MNGSVRGAPSDLVSVHDFTYLHCSKVRSREKSRNTWVWEQKLQPTFVCHAYLGSWRANFGYSRKPQAPNMGPQPHTGRVSCTHALELMFDER